MVSHVSDRDNEVVRQLPLHIQGPLFAVTDLLLRQPSGDVLAGERTEAQVASSRLNESLRKWVAQVELGCDTVSQCRPRRCHGCKPGRGCYRSNERRGVKDAKATAEHGFLIYTVGNPQPWIEILGLGVLKPPARAVDTYKSDAARQSAQ